MKKSEDSSEQETGSEGGKNPIVSLRILILINLIGWGGIMGGITLAFFDFTVGILLVFGIGLGLWLINLTLLIKQKITKEILLLNLICGGLMIIASILAQFTSSLYLTERSFLDSFLIMAPFFWGGFLIADSIRFYRRRTQQPPKKPPTLSPRLSFLGGFISISVFGTAIYILFISTDPILMVICLLVGFTSIIPLNYVLRRYLPSISSEISKELLEKMKKFIFIGILGVTGLFILNSILFLTEIPIPINILLAALLLLLQTFIVLYYILKYFYYPEKLK
ncbi:MAG: hypothetical protein HWN65_00595 [Candidatus Helarchaeota archaeon]|nr:hypothetical protein [Candidatus Helarchaeota archaeon]